MTRFEYGLIRLTLIRLFQCIIYTSTSNRLEQMQSVSEPIVLMSLGVQTTLWVAIRSNSDPCCHNDYDNKMGRKGFLL